MTPRTPLSKDTIVEESAYTPGEMRAYDKFWDRMSLIATAGRTAAQGDDPAPKRCIAFCTRPPPGKHWH